jgi:hypothetical protein
VDRRVPPLTLQSSESPAQYGDTLVYTASVGTGSGTVDFTVDADQPAPIHRTADVKNGVATFEVAGLILGAHTIDAAYSGDGTFLPGTERFTQTMNVRPTITTVTSSRNPSAVGQSVTFRAAVSAGAGLVPTGAVVFTIGNSPQAALTATVPLDDTGVATFTTSNLLVGAHTVKVSYPNAAPFAGSVGTLGQTVTRATSSVSLTSSRASSVWGQSMTFTATLTPDVAQGSIDFMVDGKLVVRAVIGNTGVATLTTSTLAVGAHTVVAKYSGSAVLAPSSSTTLKHTVAQARSKVVLTSNIARPAVGASITFTAVVSAVAPGVGTPTGNVQFLVDGKLYGAAPLVHGRAGLITKSIPAGNHTVTAKYVGNPKTFLTSSASITQRVG